MSRIIAHRAANGETVCSPNTASYCNARSRILTKVLRTWATRTAEELQASVADQWKWNGRSVFIFDGSSVSMPDTPENQAVYPQPPNQKPGLGFPLARIGVLLSLATGACHDLTIAPYKGKGTGETNLFRRMYDTLKSHQHNRRLSLCLQSGQLCNSQLHDLLSAFQSKREALCLAARTELQ